MRRAWWVLLVVAGCSSSGGGGDLSGAFCADLEAGLTPVQIYRGVQDQYEPEEFAGLAYGFAAIDCREQFETNEAFRAYVEAWGFDPDNVPEE